MPAIWLYLRDPNSKVETPINVRFHYDGNKIRFSSGEKILPQYWNEKNQTVRKSHDRHAGLNAFLKEVGNSLNKIYTTANTNAVKLTREYLQEEIRKILNKEEEKIKSFYDYFDEFLGIHKTIRKANTIKKFISLRNHLKRFEEVTRIKVSFEKMNSAFYEKFTSFLITDKKHLNNSIGKYVSALKTFLHWATERGYGPNPGFLKFKTPNEEADIIYLTEKELMKLYSFDFKGNERLRQVRDVFCFGCFTALRYSDIARLRKENVKNDEIHFKTAKTRDSLIVPLNDFAKEILKKYDYKLPVISNQKTNDNLKEMGEVAGLKEIIILTKYRGVEEVEFKAPKFQFLTSHVARRTFVTLSLEKGMRVETVMAITGHKDYKTFKKYIKITSTVKMVEMKQVWKKDTALSIVS